MFFFSLPDQLDLDELLVESASETANYIHIDEVKFLSLKGWRKDPSWITISISPLCGDLSELASHPGNFRSHRSSFSQFFQLCYSFFNNWTKLLVLRYAILTNKIVCRYSLKKKDIYFCPLFFGNIKTQCFAKWLSYLRNPLSPKLKHQTKIPSFQLLYLSTPFFIIADILEWAICSRCLHFLSATSLLHLPPSGLYLSVETFFKNYDW